MLAFGRTLGVAFVVGSVALAGFAVAAGTPDELITARQNAMKANAEAQKSLAGIARGTQPYDPAIVTAALDAMTAALAAQRDGNVWDASAQQGSAVKSRAARAIWQQPDAFAAAMKELETAIATVRPTTDLASFKAAYSSIGSACRDCHDQFRTSDG